MLSHFICYGLVWHLRAGLEIALLACYAGSKRDALEKNAEQQACTQYLANAFYRLGVQAEFDLHTLCGHSPGYKPSFPIRKMQVVNVYMWFSFLVFLPSKSNSLSKLWSISFLLLAGVKLSDFTMLGSYKYQTWMFCHWKATCQKLDALNY